MAEKDRLLHLADRLAVPRVRSLREKSFQIAHDTAGQFGTDKTYAALRGSFHWSNMRRDLAEGYIPACVTCVRNKSRTAPAGSLHPLPVLDGRGESAAVDFGISITIRHTLRPLVV